MNRIASDDGLRVFGSACDGHGPFKDSISANLPFRGILFPTNGYSLNLAQWSALFSAHQSISSSGILALPSELPSEEWHDFGCWELEVSDDYWDLQSKGMFSLENSILDRQGNWALQVSQEAHALIGGSWAFAVSLFNAYPAFLNERDAFKLHWENRQNNGDDAAWAFSILDCLTGRSTSPEAFASES